MVWEGTKFHFSNYLVLNMKKGKDSLNLNE